MKQPIFLQSYEDWKHCITELCRISLTLDYVDARIAALANAADYGTQRFLQTWGQAHLDRVRQWFVEAREELVGGGAS